MTTGTGCQNYRCWRIVLLMEMRDILSAADAAAALGISVDRVYALIKAQRLPARKISRDWAIARSDLALVADRRPGRPRRSSSTEGQP